MANTAVKIAVIESELGWDRRIDDWMVCLTEQDAKAFQQEFNARNDKTATPDWYMQVEGDPKTINISYKQYVRLQTEKRMWLSEFKKII